MGLERETWNREHKMDRIWRTKDTGQRTKEAKDRDMREERLGHAETDNTKSVKDAATEGQVQTEHEIGTQTITSRDGDRRRDSK